MMKFLIVALVAMTAVIADNHHDYPDPSKFADWLKDVQKSHEFADMTPDDKLLYSQLIQAAEQGSAALTTFIDSQTFDKIVGLIDHLDDDDIPHFEAYLAYHLHGTITKRQSDSDLFSFLRDLHLMHKIEDDLSHQDMQVFLEIMYAAEHNNLTQYIANKGYGPVLDLMSQIDKDESHGFDMLIMRHLEHEASTAST
uniref:Putative perlucin 2 n=1 Tax=Haliotis discus discus TaxID=91233 RepID=B6RAY9_HALDI|nr:putative perlucin 2 [Haliotis discus discus]